MLPSSITITICCLVVSAVAAYIVHYVLYNKKNKFKNVMQQPTKPTETVQFNSYYKYDDCEIIDDIYIPSMIKNHNLLKKQ